MNNLIYSLIFTSSAIDVIYSIRLHPPTLQCQDITLLDIKQPFPTYVLWKIAQFLSLEPAPIRQYGPITTLGPILHSGPIVAEGSIKQQPSVF